MRELIRVGRDLVAYSFNSRKVVLLMVVAAVGIVATISTAVTSLGPVMLYPFL